MTGNPRIETANDDPAVGPARAPGSTLVEQLGKTVDDLRQLYTDFGLRPYRVFSVVTRWSGGAPGRGDEALVSETELLPTPVVKVDGLRGELTSGGLTERGTTRLSELSPRYTEDEIRQLFHCEPLPDGLQGWIEIRIDARDGSTERRRFVTRGVPERDAERFQWRSVLIRQDSARTRSGALGRP